MAKVKQISYSWDEGFSDLPKDDAGSAGPHRYEHSWCCPKDIGRGRFRRIEFQSGFDLMLTECSFNKSINVSSDDIPPSLIVFEFFVSGYAKSIDLHQNEPYEWHGGQQGVFFLPDPNVRIHIDTSMVTRHVGITIEAERLLSNFGKDLPRLPPVLQRILEIEHDEEFRHVQNITPVMYTALRQLLNCPYHGMTRRLYLESRILELVAHQLEQVSTETRSETTHVIISSNERKRIEAVREVLLRDLENPPGLRELARVAGMSHPKLNCCFRHMYGMTVFQYLRNERLDRAHEMLKSRRLNVTETANAVGYGNISYFSQAYKKRFGVSPGIHSRSS